MRKSVKNLMTISIVSIVIGVILFVIWPIILQALASADNPGESVVALGVQAFAIAAGGLTEASDNLLVDFMKGSILSIGKIFDFQNLNTYSLISLILFFVTIALWLIWLIVVIARKKTSSVGAVIVGLFTMGLSYIIIHSLFLMNVGEGEVTYNLTSYLLELKKSMQASNEALSSAGATTDQLNFPVFILIFVFGALGLAILAYLLNMIESLVDMCSKPVSKYVEVSPLDEVVNKEDLTSVDELRKLLKEEVMPTPVVEHKVEQPVAAAPQGAVAAQQAPAQPFIFQQFFGSNGMPMVQQNVPNAPVTPAPTKEEILPPLKEEDVRKIVHEEVTNGLNNILIKETLHGELPTGHGNEIRAIIKDEVNKALNAFKEDVRKIVQEELDEVTVKALPAYEPQPQVIREIIREVPAKEEKVENNAPVEPIPVTEPVEEKKEEVHEEVVKESEPQEVVAAPALEPVSEEAVVEAPIEEEKPKIIRVPFTDRVRIMDEGMRNNFNDLKSDIMAYGVKSRVSNSGDTFRLHTKTYVKITIAGKSLKLYFALNPDDYKDTTLPIADAGHKGIYKEIPLVFKVKSDLSLRRAKQLIADAMAKDGLVQGEVVSKDWIQEIIDTYPETGKLEAAGLVLNDEDEEE